MSLAKDKAGQSPLHKAVIRQHKDITEHIVTAYPNTVKCRDQVSIEKA